MSKEITLSLGDFHCVIRGYDNPLLVMREIADLFAPHLDEQKLQERILEIERAYKHVEIKRHSPHSEKNDDFDSHAVERLLAQVDAQFNSMQTGRSGNLLAQLRAAAAQKSQSHSAENRSHARDDEQKIFSRAAPLNLSPEQRIEITPPLKSAAE